MQKILLLLAASAFANFAAAKVISTENRADWQSEFAAAKISGVFVLCELNSESCQTNDKVRAKTAFIPASTYKIPHTLIALESGAIADEKQIFKWDGVPRSLPQWNQDFTLRGAMQHSVVPIYQNFARAIGEQKMKKSLIEFNYGNADISGGIDHFWLDGALRISAFEQIDFLQKLYANKLPAKKENQLIVKDAMLSDASTEYLIRSKTGYSKGAPGYGEAAKTAIGWWVGWVEKGAQVYFFAANFDIQNDAQLALRKSLPLKLLQAEKILP